MHFSLFTCEQNGVSARVRSTFVLVAVIVVLSEHDLGYKTGIELVLT
jgi:hypothetical protein